MTKVRNHPYNRGLRGLCGIVVARALFKSPFPWFSSSILRVLKRIPKEINLIAQFDPQIVVSPNFIDPRAREESLRLGSTHRAAFWAELPSPSHLEVSSGDKPADASPYRHNLAQRTNRIRAPSTNAS
jgi:hypothetical protein